MPTGLHAFPIDPVLQESVTGATAIVLPRGDISVGDLDYKCLNTSNTN